jgi:hypothetical protein
LEADVEMRSNPNWIVRQWQRLRQWQWRYVVINQVGANAQNVAVGKNIFQINIGGRNLTVPVLTAVLALLFVAGYLLYPSVEYLWNPSQMSGGFKIAVADFGLVDGSGRVQRSSFASMLSKAVFDKLESEYRENYPQLLGKTASSVQIWHDSQGREVKNLHFGVISSEAEAKTLAKTINADLVIYGTLTPGEQAEDFALQFYYAGETQRGEPDAISGRHLFSALCGTLSVYVTRRRGNHNKR